MLGIREYYYKVMNMKYEVKYNKLRLHHAEV